MRTFLLLLFSFAATALAGYQPPQPSQEVAILRETLHDDARHRDVPVKIYCPGEGSGPWPVIIFSHGLGGSREGYEYLGRYWAGCGYVSVHVQHAGSDESIWKGLPPAQIKSVFSKAAHDPFVAVERTKDIPFVIDELTRLNADKNSPLACRLDLKHIGMSGHSFGGWSTMVAVGQSLALPGTSFADSRIRAAIQMSGPTPKNLAAAKFPAITTPLFHMTGTLDDSPIGDTDAAQRRIPFDEMTSPSTCLLTFNGADHMTFSGRRNSGAEDAKFHRLICQASTAWWDAWLRGDAKAKTWFYDGGFARLLGSGGTFETKAAP